LWKDGRNIFADNGKLNDTGRHFVGGLQKHMAEMSICGTVTPNGYRRRQPFSFCPINTTWGPDNRTVGIRIIEGSDTAVRVEKRDGTAEANPYLMLAADIAAGLEGIEQGIEPTEATTGNAYEDETAEPIPTDLRDAVKLARESAWLKDRCGDHMHELMCQLSEREIEFVNAQVTQVELDRYLRNY
jgi:glutamine synthetase